MDAVTAATTALGLANSAVSAVKSAYELSKKTSDLDLKHQISHVLDTVLDLKVKIIELDEENRMLRQQVEQKDNLKRDAVTGFWFKDGDEAAPLCPKCYESDNKLIYLTHNRASEYSSENYLCKVCKFQRYPR
jgi:hypothetical protein